MGKSKSKNKKDVSVKRQDIECAKQILSAIVQSFNLQAGFILPQLRQLKCDLKPAVYYPDKGNAIYLGYKLVLPSEEAAKYFAKCFEIAGKELSK